MDVHVDLAKRNLRIGTVHRQLSDINIQQLRQLCDSGFDDRAAEKAIHDVINDQITPFLRDAGIEPSQEAIEREVNEAFDTHLYVYVDPD
ncbi:MAG: hypothetical protein SV186_00715 [Candidatus Nanohaloarchaea archaeon]|nr:hypothetical protein [Candidatus Nanohaloarchaea archaeon]